MSSNVFVVTDGRVLTPDKGILVGTVRNLVLEVGTGNFHDEFVPHSHHLRRCTIHECSWVASDHIISHCVS